LTLHRDATLPGDTKMDPTQQFKALQESVQTALVTATRTVNGLANEDLQFQRTAHPSVGNHLDDKTQRILDLANSLLKSAGEVTGQKVSALEDTDDVDIQWRGIVDNIDGLLEKADTSLDDYTGLIKRKDAPTPEGGRDSKRTKPTNERLDWSLMRANILKPQEIFEKPPDNFNTAPWKPVLTQKPHARVPLKQSLAQGTDDEFRHPYETEIVELEYPRAIYERHEPIKYLPIESTEAIWVDTYEGVLEMLEELKIASEIAIDLEHHDFRTYTGLLSLMQISTREKDWVVDTLVPWRHKLEILNEVFADPKIVKVLHGAKMDIIWLQRDLGLYVVGLFDTYHAVDVLGTYPTKSLAALLKKFVGFDADKRYQLADWRIRLADNLCGNCLR
jgi:exosome complex exonuclease RRP6